ncbi:MAG: NADH-quinone oxidoreductase subunit NuoB [Holosporales bacterium]|jgi:NADH-quinone oxidoreductase subunit B|nr:NADH-quinone oxidoreductase subunit NuoB [Holosporales bacterium]
MNSLSDIFLTNLEKIAKWARDRSVWPLAFGTSCCAVEMMHAAASRIDLDRYGCLFRASPKQADLMIVAGTVTVKLAEQVKILYDQMLFPKYVIAMGSCAISGGIYVDSPHVIQGIDKIVPVDAYILGCPPLPEDLAFEIMKIKGQHT